MSNFINIVTKSVIDTLYLTGMIIFVGFILGILRESSMKNFQKSFGWTAVRITAVIGVPLHELSHALFCLIFRHKIEKVVLLQKRDANGTLGYVNHSYNRKSIYQQIGNFFIGVAPIFGGVTAIILLMYLLLPESYSEFIGIYMSNLQSKQIDINSINEILMSYIALIKIIFKINNFFNLNFLIFIFLSICISTHISLSPADIKGAFRGLIVIFILLFIVNLLGLSNSTISNSILKYNIILIGFLMISIIFSTITYLISLSLTLLKK